MAVDNPISAAPTPTRKAFIGRVTTVERPSCPDGVMEDEFLSPIFSYSSPTRTLNAPRSAHRRIETRYGTAAGLICALFFVFEVVTILLSPNGTFLDEGIYIVAGQRSLQGMGVSDGYLTWFAGSLIWPIFASVGYTLFGLVGTRLFALLFVGVALVATVRASRNLFGARVSFWTALSLVLSGPTLALAHLGVIDTTALAGIGLSFWAVTEFIRRNNRIWLVATAVAFSVGVLSKYPMVLCGLPLVGLILVTRGKRARMDILLLAYASLAMLLSYFLPVRSQITAFLHWRVVNNPSFGTTTLMVRYWIAYLVVVPFLLALAGWVVARGQRRVAAVLLSAIFIWPAYHIGTNNTIGASKHVVFGLLFAYPLVGLALNALWTSWVGRGVGRRVLRGLVKATVVAMVLALALLGALQMLTMDRSWPDVHAASSYLSAHVRPGARLLINDDWPYTADLYAKGRISSPWDVYDTYRIEHHQNPIGLCNFDWMVSEGVVGVDAVYSWPGTMTPQLMKCRSYRRVMTTTSTVVNLGRNLDFVTYRVRTIVWRRVASTTMARVGAHRPMLYHPSRRRPTYKRIPDNDSSISHPQNQLKLLPPPVLPAGSPRR